MSKLLTAVKRTAARREAADREYRQALDPARAKHTLSEISDAAGISVSGIYYLLSPTQRGRKEP
jgi:hypothetical protein